MTPLDLLLCCTLAYHLHGTPDAIKSAAYRVGKKMARSERRFAAMFINCKDPVATLGKALEYWENE